MDGFERIREEGVGCFGYARFESGYGGGCSDRSWDGDDRHRLCGLEREDESGGEEGVDGESDEGGGEQHG